MTTYFICVLAITWIWKTIIFQCLLFSLTVQWFLAKHLRDLLTLLPRPHLLIPPLRPERQSELASNSPNQSYQAPVPMASCHGTVQPMSVPMHTVLPIPRPSAGACSLVEVFLVTVVSMIFKGFNFRGFNKNISFKDT